MMRFSTWLFIVEWLLSAFGLSVAAEDRFSGLDAYVGAAIAKWEVPGLAIGVVKDGELVLTRGYGYAQIGTERSVTKDTVFAIASCTKPFTATCLGMLVDERKLAWDDPVQKHLPGFVVSDTYVTQHATLRDLLCHRTGLVRGDLLSVKGEFDRKEILRRTRFLGQAAPFRTKFTYNNLMFAELGEVVARTSGMTWQQFISQRIIEPLELRSTFVSRSKVPPDRLATRHRRYDGSVPPLAKPIRDDEVAPAGVIHSTVVDMATWLKLHLQQGRHAGRVLLKADPVQEMHALHQSIPIRWEPNASPYRAQVVGTGLGWFVRDYRGRKVVQHGGGWGADTAIVPEENLAVVVLSNLDHNLLVSMLIYDAIDAYVLGPEEAWSRGEKWDYWLSIGGPGHMDRPRQEQRAELERSRVAGTKPSLPLEDYAGTFESDLYGTLEVRHAGDRLWVCFGDHTAELSHWQDDMFYSRSVVEPFLDWLVKFQPGPDKAVRQLEIVHVGWKDPDERHFFGRRGPEGIGSLL